MRRPDAASRLGDAGAEKPAKKLSGRRAAVCTAREPRTERAAFVDDWSTRQLHQRIERRDEKTASGRSPGEIRPFFAYPREKRRLVARGRRAPSRVQALVSKE